MAATTRDADAELVPTASDRNIPARWEWWLVAGLALASVVFQVVHSSDVWFTSDFWGLITSRPEGPLGWFEPHGGHLVVIDVAVAEALYRLVGIREAMPWFSLLRAVTWAGLGVTFWWVWRRRGADPRVAMAGGAVLLFYGGSGWIMGWLVGNPLGFTAGLLACWLVAARDTPTLVDNVVLAVLLGVAVVGASATLLGALALGFGIVVTGRLWRWWPALLVPLVAYVGWRLAVSPRTLAPALGEATVAGLPWDALRMAQAGYGRLLAVPEVGGWIATVAVVAGVVVLAVRRELSVFELVLVTWMGLFVAATVLSRIAAGQASLATIRYGYALVLLTLSLVLPHVRLPSGRVATSVLVVVGVVLAAGNAFRLLDGTQGFRWWEARSQASRPVVETAAVLLDRGEPAVADAPIDYPRAGMLTVDRLREVDRNGWEPAASSDPAIVTFARGDLRVRSRPTGQVPVGTTCTTGAVDQPIDLTEESWIVLDNGPVTVITMDRFGRGAQPLAVFRSAVWEVRVTAETEATLATADGRPVTVCQ